MIDTTSPKEKVVKAIVDLVNATQGKIMEFDPAFVINGLLPTSNINVAVCLPDGVITDEGDHIDFADLKIVNSFNLYKAVTAVFISEMAEEVTSGTEKLKEAITSAASTSGAPPRKHEESDTDREMGRLRSSGEFGMHTIDIDEYEKHKKSSIDHQMKHLQNQTGYGEEW